MKQKKGFHIIKIPIYHGKVYVKFCKDFIKHAHKIGVELRVDANKFDGLAFRKGSGFCMLLNKGISDGVISHECLHVVNYILNDVGVEATTKNDEGQAYLLTWLVNEVYKIKKK